MLRMVVVVFFGRPRSDQARAGREAPWVMITPLILLAFFAFASGFSFVARVFLHLPGEKQSSWLIPGMAIAATLSGMTLAILLYRRRDRDPIDLALLRKGFYFDEIYGFFIAATQGVLARLSGLIDRWILDRGVIQERVPPPGVSAPCSGCFKSEICRLIRSFSVWGSLV